jgi:hypothetical protein
MFKHDKALLHEVKVDSPYPNNLAIPGLVAFFVFTSVAYGAAKE